MPKKIKLLIDGDILVYRMGFACQMRNKKIEPIENALHLVKKCINEMKQKFKTHNVKVYLTAADKSNFRYNLAKSLPYKGNRDKSVNPKAAGRPVHYDDIRKYISNNYNSEIIKNYEADDALGIHQMKEKYNIEMQTIICSVDKDLDMIPGWHYNFVNDKLYESEDPGELYISEDKRKISGTGYKWFYAQMLLGDVSDNIPGIKGYGPVKTFELLAELYSEEELAKKVQSIYTKENIPMDRYFEVADLLWIWRKPSDCKSLHLRGILK